MSKSDHSLEYQLPLQIFQKGDPVPKILITQEGIEERTKNIGIIPWKDIELSFLTLSTGKLYISLALKPQSAFLKDFTLVQKVKLFASQFSDFGEITLPVSGLEIEPSLIHLVIKDQLRSKKSKRQAS